MQPTQPRGRATALLRRRQSQGKQTLPELLLNPALLTPQRNQLGDVPTASSTPFSSPNYRIEFEDIIRADTPEEQSLLINQRHAQLISSFSTSVPAFLTQSSIANFTRISYKFFKLT